MTNKQTIIDGVDVSGCCFYSKHYTEDEDVEIKHFCKIFHYHCETEPNCYYKQLKRKEQECEELKFQNKRLDEVALYWHKRIFKVERSERKLKQTLAEIKDIIKFNRTNRLSGGCDISIEQILQKISEVEDDN